MGNWAPFPKFLNDNFKVERGAVEARLRDRGGRPPAEPLRELKMLSHAFPEMILKLLWDMIFLDFRSFLGSLFDLFLLKSPRS